MKTKPLMRTERIPPPTSGALGGNVVSLAQSASSLGGYVASDFLRTSGGTLWGTLIAAPKGAEENVQMVIGNLDDYYGYTDDTFGLAIGEFAAGKINLTLEQTNGLRIRYYTTPIITLDTDGNASFTGEITASSGEIGGWEIGETSLSGGDAILSSTGYLLLGTSDNIVRLDASDATYRLWIGNSTASNAPFSVTKDGFVYASNVSVSGAIRSTVFQKDLIQAQAGTLLITKSAGRISGTYTVGGSLTVETPPGGGWLFETNDVVRIKDDTHDTWITVTRTDTTNVYTTTRVYGDNGVSYAAGVSAIDYGQSGQGFLMITADAENAPYYSVRTHSGSPWLSETEIVRLGNLKGAFGAYTTKMGLAVGNEGAGNYLLADSDGLSIVSGNGATTIDAQGISITVPQAGMITSLGGPEDIKWIYKEGENECFPFLLHVVYGSSEEPLTEYIFGQIIANTTGLASYAETYIRLIAEDSQNETSLLMSSPGSITAEVVLNKTMPNEKSFGFSLEEDHFEVSGTPLKAEEIRLPYVTRFAEIGTGASSSNYWARNAYSDGSDWRRLQDDQDACVLILNASGFFGVYNATDSGNTAGSVITLTEHLRVSDNGRVKPYRLQLDLGDTLTISSGEITPTKSFHKVDTEGGSSADDLTTINGGASGDILVLMPASDSRTVVLKHDVSGGNLKLARGDFSLDGLWDTIILISDGTNWYEISRSDNRA